MPVGGGGLIGGIAVAVKGRSPSTEVVGVEASLYPAMRVLLDGIERPSGGPTLAEGIAVRNVGRITSEIVARLVPDVILVEESTLERAVNALLTLQKTVAEGAGPPALPRCSPSRNASAARRWGSSCAAATSTRACSPASWCASWSGTSASSPSA